MCVLGVQWYVCLFLGVVQFMPNRVVESCIKDALSVIFPFCLMKNCYEHLHCGYNPMPDIWPISKIRMTLLYSPVTKISVLGNSLALFK